MPVEPKQSELGTYDPVQVEASSNFTAIDGTLFHQSEGFGDVPAGAVLGQRTSDNKYGVVVRATIQSQASGTASISVDTTEYVKSGVDVIIDYNGSNVESGTVIAKDADNSTITLSSAVSNVHASGTTIRGDDGTQTAVGVYHLPYDIDISKLDNDPVVPFIVRGLVFDSALQHSDSEAKTDLADAITTTTKPSDVA